MNVRMCGLDPPSVALLMWLFVVTVTVVTVLYIIYRTTKSAPATYVAIVAILIIYAIIATGMNSDKEYILKSIKPPFENFASTYGTKPLWSTYEEANSPMRCGPCAEKGVLDVNSISSSPYSSSMYHNEGNFVGNCNGLKPPGVGSSLNSCRENYEPTSAKAECMSVRNVKPAYVKRIMNCANSYDINSPYGEFSGGCFTSPCIADGTADTLIPYAV